uniref:Uncharacterized protein n=1 Tax=Arundo donax TaxID=35708 RepID=A0A0A9HZ51_ARUDO
MLVSSGCCSVCCWVTS